MTDEDKRIWKLARLAPRTKAQWQVLHDANRELSPDRDRGLQAGGVSRDRGGVTMPKDQSWHGLARLRQIIQYAGDTGQTPDETVWLTVRQAREIQDAIQKTENYSRANDRVLRRTLAQLEELKQQS